MTRKIIEDLELVKFDGVNETRVYNGSMTELLPLPVRWKVENWGEFGNVEVIKLSEIVEQYPDEILTVITESPMHGEIYQYGNYKDGEWYLIGETIGYA